MTTLQELTATVNARPDLRVIMELGRKKATIRRYAYQIWERRNVDKNADILKGMVAAWLEKTDWTMGEASEALDILTPAYIKIVVQGPPLFTPADSRESA